MLAAGLVAVILPAGFAAGADEARHQGRAQGRLYLDRRTPVVGATARLESGDAPGRLFLTATDGSGVFRVDGLPDGAYRLRVRREGLLTAEKSDVRIRFPFRAVVELPMQRGHDAATAVPAAAAADAGGAPHDVQGKVTLAGSEPLGEVEVRLVRPDGSVDPRSVVSDEDGVFRIDGLKDGPWSLTVSAAGMLTLRDRIELDGPLKLDISMVRQPADYEASPLDLMPPEEPVPPAALADQSSALRTAK